jgi:molybdopterin-guanine dinucleotide biosynthesis protein B
MRAKKPNPRILAVVGAKRSGKTTTVEALVRELSLRGYRVATVKHISEDYLSLDHVGKDTWRYTQAGASTIVGVAAKEIVTIEKTATADTTLDDILKRVGSCDFIVLEGFKKLVSNIEDIPKIVPIRSNNEATNASQMFAPIIAFTGSLPTETSCSDIPYVDPLRDPKKLTDLVLKNSL